MKKFLCILIVLCILPLSGCNFLGGSFEDAKDKTFSAEGMTIVLSEKFVESEYEPYTCVYDSQRVAVFALKEEFSLQEGFEDLTLPEYAQLVIDNNGLDSPIESIEGLTCFSYEKQADGKDNSYFSCIFKASDAFWLVQFACETKYYDEMSDLMIKWAQSVTF